VPINHLLISYGRIRSSRLNDKETMMKTRWIMIAGGGLILVALMLALMPTMMGGSAYGGMLGPGMMGGYGQLAGVGWLGMLVMGLFWIGVILLVVAGLNTMRSMRRPDDAPDAHEILKRRYARGEIGREEFEQARAALQ
jgi:putative membrane protein